MVNCSEFVGTLTAKQLGRLIRVVRVTVLAEDTFVDQSKAHTWFRRPTTTMGDEGPLDLLDTEEGAREVETVLGRIAHGLAT